MTKRHVFLGLAVISSVVFSSQALALNFKWENCVILMKLVYSQRYSPTQTAIENFQAFKSQYFIYNTERAKPLTGKLSKLDETLRNQNVENNFLGIFIRGEHSLRAFSDAFEEAKRHLDEYKKAVGTNGVVVKQFIGSYALALAGAVGLDRYYPDQILADSVLLYLFSAFWEIQDFRLGVRNVEDFVQPVLLGQKDWAFNAREVRISSEFVTKLEDYWAHGTTPDVLTHKEKNLGWRDILKKPSLLFAPNSKKIQINELVFRDRTNLEPVYLVFIREL